MVFSSLYFLYLFLPLCLFFYFIGRKLQYRNSVLILFSLLFYAWGEPIWVSLLIFSASIDYIHGKVIETYRGHIGAKLALISSLVLNLGLLGVFKYAGFLMENVNLLTGLSLPTPHFGLPIGISFYTFQTLSYTIDVYRERVPVQHSFRNFFMYVSLFPQLVAGPIVRYADIMEEIEDRHTSLEDFSYGITRFCAGLGKKVLIANTAGKLASNYLDSDLTVLSAPAAWFGLLLFSLQIYYDFSGYSDMAIGLGRIFGFRFYENFAHPYISRSVTEFWRRWHISLGGFFRDYLYIPLGGNRKHQYLNLLIVWFLTGLWHGASWNFILWGLYFGVFIMLEKKILLKALSRIPRFISHLYLLIVAVFGWAIFYFTDLKRLFLFVSALFGMNGASVDPMLGTIALNHIFFLLAAVIGCMPVMPVINAKLTQKGKTYAPAIVSIAQLLGCVVLLTLSTIMLVGSSYNPFLYFRY